MTKRNFILSVLFALLITLFIFIVACTKKEPLSVDSPEDNQGTFMNLAEMDTTVNDGGLGKIITGEQIKITKIKLKRSAWAYEPWWKGKAGLYFRVYDYDANTQGPGNAADWIPWDLIYEDL